VPRKRPSSTFLRPTLPRPNGPGGSTFPACSAVSSPGRSPRSGRGRGPGDRRPRDLRAPVRLLIPRRDPHRPVPRPRGPVRVPIDREFHLSEAGGCASARGTAGAGREGAAEWWGSGGGGRPRWVLGVSSRSWLAVTAMRRPGREGSSGRRHGSVRSRDLRGGRIARRVRRSGRSPTSVTVPCGRGHEEPRGASSVHEDAGNVTLPCAFGPSSGLRSGPDDALRGGHCCPTRTKA
jgi:hypothetical protein